MNLAQSSSNLLLGVTIPQSLHFFYFLIQTFDPQQPPAIQSRAFNDPLGDGDSLACFDSSGPLPVDDSSPFSAPSPFIPSMHFFIGRIWDRGLKGVPVRLIFSTDTLFTLLLVHHKSNVGDGLLEKSSCLPPVCLCHLPILLFGHKLHTFSTKATIRDIGQFGTHCHRLPFNKINLVKNGKLWRRVLKSFISSAILHDAALDDVEVMKTMAQNSKW